MRTNLPITNHEIVLSDHFSVVSTTDLQGNITYCNPYFVEVSGYSVQELMGHPTISCATPICLQRLLPTCGPPFTVEAHGPAW
jgi:PAS domain-containing protein